VQAPADHWPLPYTAGGLIEPIASARSATSGITTVVPLPIRDAIQKLVHGAAGRPAARGPRPPEVEKALLRAPARRRRCPAFVDHHHFGPARACALDGAENHLAPRGVGDEVPHELRLPPPRRWPSRWGHADAVRDARARSRTPRDVRRVVHGAASRSAPARASSPNERPSGRIGGGAVVATFTSAQPDA